MTATSDLVIRGRVAAIKPGRWIGEGSDREQLRDVTVTVEKVYLNKLGSAPTTIPLDEWGWDAEGRGYQFEGVGWSKPGDRGFYFLHQVRDAPGQFRLINSQGRVFVTEKGLAPSAQDDDPLHTAIEAQSEDTFQASIRRAVKDFQAGNVRPAPEPPMSK